MRGTTAACSTSELLASATVNEQALMPMLENASAEVNDVSQIILNQGRHGRGITAIRRAMPRRNAKRSLLSASVHTL